MIDLGFIKRLIETVEASNIDTLELSRWGTKIRISKRGGLSGGEVLHVTAGGAAPVSGNAGAATNSHPSSAESEAEEETTTAKAALADSNLVEVESPMVGTFYRAPAPDADPYVEVGDHVSKGQTLCILEAMKLMNELEAEVAGTIKEICVENAEPVEYGQVIFRILPD